MYQGTNDGYWDEDIDFDRVNGEYLACYNEFMGAPFDETTRLPQVISLKEYDNLVDILKKGQKALRLSGMLSTMEQEYDFTDPETVFAYEEGPDVDAIIGLDDYYRAKEEYEDFMEERKNLAHFVYEVLETKRFYDKNSHLVDCRVC